MTIRINVDGQLGSERDRLLSPLDQGFLFGASVYETVRTYDGVPFLVERHLKRLRESALALGIDIVESDETLTRRVYETLENSGNAESSIRIVVSAGVGAIDYRQGSTKKPTIVVVVRPLPPFPESLYKDGATASFVSIMRAGRGNLSPRIKSSNLLNNLMALRQAHERGAYEALMLNPKGEVCEGSMSNVFVVTDATIATPPISAGILEGITRELVVSIVREGGFDLEEQNSASRRASRRRRGFHHRVVPTSRSHRESRRATHSRRPSRTRYPKTHLSLSRKSPRAHARRGVKVKR